MQIILVIVALLVTPLALLARAGDSAMPGCDGMCCLPHGPHHRSSPPASAPSQDGMACHHAAAGRLMDCSMHSTPQRMDYGLLAPFPPARASALATVGTPPSARSHNSRIPTGNLSAGFLHGPFQPPRS
ncbi:MAG: hypothetical protein WA192_14925 [Candidatus Acidiferrales bacterium]